MPQRRSYAPTPMNAPQTGNTGRAMTPPNLGQSASPLPPMPALPPGANAQPPPAGTPPSAPQPLSPMSAGAGNMKPPVPTSIPLQPASPSGAAQNALGTGTVDPWDVQPFLSSHDDMSRQSQHQFRLPNESTTTSATLNDEQPDESDDGSQQIPMTLLKMMGALGR